jgi:hypothetical protein
MKDVFVRQASKHYRNDEGLSFSPTLPFFWAIDETLPHSLYRKLSRSQMRYINVSDQHRAPTITP